MKIKHTEEMTFEAMRDALRSELPYPVEIKKNPMGFQYLEVKKSGTVGVWIRVFEKKGRVQLMNAIPSFMARLMLGGLLLIAFTHSAQSKVRKESGAILINKFGTQEM
ncbi:MAG: hypothetical protein QNK23_05000 [Crocinitomicaceae bacterium]|nr:hypothetical protein [Crocinitomicaceae bacterium]